MNSIILEKFKHLIGSLFQENGSKSSKLLNNILLVIIFFFGMFVWVRFLNFGDIPEDRLDWADITFPRLEVLQQAIQSSELPLYITDEKGLKEVTNLFLSIPDQILSPDVLLLRFMTIEQFIVLHVIFFYAIGFLGLIMFKKKYRISFISFFLLFLLFNFNGHIVSHLSVGHLTWASYFLLSFFFYLIFGLFDKQSAGWNWIAKMAFLMLLIFISGGYHQFVWAIIFLSILVLVFKNNKKTIFLSILFSIFVNVFRIFPAALLSGKLDIEFMAGFPSMEKIIEGTYKMTSLGNTLYFDNTKVDVLGWELYFYLGLLGFVFILYFGVTFFRDNKDLEIIKLIIPSMVLLLLATGNFYKVFFDSKIPLLSGERISSRFLIMPILVLLFSSTFQTQKLFSTKHNTYLKSGIALGIVLIANDLMQNMAEWNIDKIIEYFPVGIYSPLLLGDGNNPLYLGLLIVGSVISTVSIVFLVFKWIRKDLKKMPD